MSNSHYPSQGPYSQQGPQQSSSPDAQQEQWRPIGDGQFSGANSYQQPGPYQSQFPQQGPYQPPSKSGSPVGWILGGCGCFALVIIFVIVSVIGGTLGLVGSAINNSIEEYEPTYPTQTSYSSANDTINWKDRPRGPELYDLIDRLYETYNPLIRSGEIYALLPDGEAVGSVYVESFRLTVVDHHSASMWGWSGGTSVDEADDLIDGKIAYLEELERQLLAGEDLSVPNITVTYSDGTVFHGDGNNPANDTTTEPLATPEAPTDAVDFAVNFPYDAGSDGNFQSEGEQLAAAFNMTVTYNFDELHQHCTRAPNYSDWVGAFCPNTPTVIYIPMDSNDEYPAYFSEPRYLDTIRHEIAHMIVFQQCGSIAPPIAGLERFEGMTNSYAVMFLGATRDLLQPTDPSDQYWMDESSDQMAQAVHDGICE